MAGLRVMKTNGVSFAQAYLQSQPKVALRLDSSLLNHLGTEIECRKEASHEVFDDLPVLRGYDSPLTVNGYLGSSLPRFA
ncbi:MAG: hypothetical protein GX162_06935 [Firmicutes bacterium]|jgi:hypothetical protein|nr:hypothetical protein [Bacillota bacterium]